MNKRKWLISISIIALIFISVSVVLIVKVNTLRAQVAHKVNCVDVTKEIDERAFSLIMESEGTLEFKDFKEPIDNIVKKAQDYPELKSIVEILVAGQKRASQAENNKLTQRERLIAVKVICASIIKDCRAMLNADSSKLNMYWKYTYTLLFIACIISVLLALAFYKATRNEELLRNEKSKSERLFENSVDSIISCDSNGLINEFNKAAEKTFGYSADEIMGLHISRVYKSTKEMDRVIDSLKEKGVFKGEAINVNKSGELIVSNLSANLIQDNEGNVIGSMGISRDVTKEKRKKQEYSNLVENSSHVIYTIDMMGICSFVNNSVTEFFGYKREDIVGKPFTEFVHEDDLEMVVKFYANQYQKGIGETTFRFKGKHKNGKTVWVAQIVKAIFSTTNEGEIVGFQGLLRNIDEQKKAELELEISEVKYTELFNNSTDLIHSIKPSGEIIYTNKSWKKALKYSEEELADMNLLDLIHPGSLDHCIGVIENLVEKKESDEGLVVYDVVAKDGTVISLEGTISLKLVNGELVSIQSFLRNVTDRNKTSKIIEYQNREISESIRYAQGIQQASLPPEIELDKALTDYFILYKPKDRLSGDFYALERYVSINDEDLIFFAVADCTGHGIPGGMLSFLCNSLLRESLTESMHNLPSESLEYVRNKLVSLFRSTEYNYIQDGMDIAMCIYEETSKTLYFSGANLDLIIIRANEILELYGDRQHVGYNHHRTDFTNEAIVLENGDRIYLTSDGFKDQFGGVKGKKYMSKRLKSKLLDIHHLSMVEQHKVLEQELNDWKGSGEQTDDVTLMGVNF